MGKVLTHHGASSNSYYFLLRGVKYRKSLNIISVEGTLGPVRPHGMIRIVILQHIVILKKTGFVAGEKGTHKHWRL